MNVGENLIADVLGPDAQYSKFTPISHQPGGTGVSAGHEVGAATGSSTQEAGRPPRPLPPTQPPANLDAAHVQRAPAPSAVKQEYDRRAAQPPPAQQQQRAPITLPPDPPADIHGAKTQILDRRTGRPVERQSKQRFPGSPGGRDPRELDPAIHDAPTLIIPPRK